MLPVEHSCNHGEPWSIRRTQVLDWEAREGHTGHGGQATEKHRTGQVTEGGESFPENWRCSMWGDWRKWSHHSMYVVFSFPLNARKGFFLFLTLGQVGRKRLWVTGRAIMVSSACPQTHGLFSDLRQNLFWSQVFLLQDAPGGTSLPWIQHSSHLVNRALLLAAHRRERHPKLPPHICVQDPSAAAVQINFLFLFVSCINLKPTNNPNQTLPPLMCAGKKQRSVKHGTTPQPLFCLGFSWHYSITFWP